MSDLREYTKLKYMGSCKCGQCQLVPLDKIYEAADEIERSRRLVKLLVLPMVIVGCIAIARGCSDASATERPAAYEIVAYRAGKDLRTDAPNIIPLPDSRHDTREACRHAILFVKVKESGMRLRCDAVETGRTR